MRIRSLIAVSLFCLMPAAAQEIAYDPMPLPRPVEMYDTVRQFLVLSPGQLSALITLQTERQAAEAKIYEQMRQKQLELNGLLESGSNDAVAIGRLMVDINNLRKQIPTVGAPFREQTLAVLDEAQKTKLGQLSHALELQPAASEAVQLNLIDYPRVPSPRILPGAQEPLSATVVSER